MRFFDKTGCNLGDRGIALILITASLAFFIILFLVFLGVSYIYSIRGQLQNAADAGALAGAALIEPGKGPGEQDAARQVAADFALENFAAGERVEVKFDGSDTIGDRSQNNDLTVGFWDVNANPDTEDPYTPADDPSFAGNPVNAVEVLARRTENRDDGRFPLFFGDIHGFFNMALASRAIAFRPPTPSSPLAFCVDSCTAFNADPNGILPEEVQLHFKEAQLPLDEVTLLPELEKGIAWTEYSQTSAPIARLQDL
jgi:Flp pilus assembly protein TadG